jgi:hypothetical protein
MSRRPEEIIGEWGVRDVTPASLRERKRLELDADVNPLVGRPFRRRMRNFTPQADTYLASLGGPLPYMQRLRQIESQIEAHEELLAAAYEERRGDATAWRGIAARWNFEEVNDLIDRHNRWFPVEARLPMDPTTRDFVEVGGRPYRRERLDAAWIFERFPV